MTEIELQEERSNSEISQLISVCTKCKCNSYLQIHFIFEKNDLKKMQHICFLCDDLSKIDMLDLQKGWRIFEKEFDKKRKVAGLELRTEHL